MTSRREPGGADHSDVEHNVLQPGDGGPLGVRLGGPAPHPAARHAHHSTPSSDPGYGYCDIKVPPKCAKASDLTFCVVDKEYTAYDIVLNLKKYADIADWYFLVSNPPQNSEKVDIFMLVYHSFLFV